MPRKPFAGRARPPLLEDPSVSDSTLTVGDDIIADGVSFLNVHVRMLGPGESRESPYVLSAEKIVS